MLFYSKFWFTLPDFSNCDGHIVNLFTQIQRGSGVKSVLFKVILLVLFNEFQAVQNICGFVRALLNANFSLLMLTI